ncbi:MAG: acetylxylan esterase [Planctomycetales bacterium]|nr:acetylxylan esterase [Planctomycetales bacterium]
MTMQFNCTGTLVLGRVCLSIICLLSAGLTQRLIADDEYAISIAADRDSAIYETGGDASFQITVTKNGEPVDEGTISYAFDDFLNPTESNALPKGDLQLGNEPTQVTFKGTKPGFIRCQVTFQPVEGKPTKAVAGIGFSPTEIKPSLPVPDDFDQYWADQKRQLSEVPREAKVTPVDFADESIACYDVQVPCLGRAPVSGYFSKPQDAAPKSLPAILWVHGAGVRSSSLGNAVQGARAGMLSLDINAHGLPNGEPASFYAEKSSGELKNYRQAGRENRDTIYFRGMFLRLIRAIDFLTDQPEWNGHEVIVIGHSQGGGQALAAGGLDERVTMIAAGVPAICDHSGAVVGRVNGWPKLVPNQPDGTPEPDALLASRYVDAVNFASRCRAQAIMSVGFVDSTCPPSSCYAAYNALRGPKSIINEPAMGHAAPEHIKQAFFEKVLEHANRRSPALAK